MRFLSVVGFKPGSPLKGELGKLPSTLDKEPLKENDRLWVAVSLCCHTALKAIRGFSPSLIDYEMQLKARCLSLYGLSLGYLRRHREAHRRFNEAHAILSRTKLGLRGVSFAALNLRRAEVYSFRARVLLSELYSFQRPKKKTSEETLFNPTSDDNESARMFSKADFWKS